MVNPNILRYSYILTNYTEEEEIKVTYSFKPEYKGDLVLIAKGTIPMTFKTLAEFQIKLLGKISLVLEIEKNTKYPTMLGYRIYLNTASEEIYLGKDGFYYIKNARNYYKRCNTLIRKIIYKSGLEGIAMQRLAPKGVFVPLPVINNFCDFEYNKTKDYIYKMKMALPLFVTRRDDKLANRCNKKFKALISPERFETLYPNRKVLAIAERECQLILQIKDVKTEYFEKSGKVKYMTYTILANDIELQYRYCPQKRRAYTLNGSSKEVSLIVWLRIWVLIVQHIYSCGICRRVSMITVSDSILNFRMLPYAILYNTKDFVQISFSRPLRSRLRVINSIKLGNNKKYVSVKYKSGMYGAKYK